jgi:hypothetical protein
MQELAQVLWNIRSKRASLELTGATTTFPEDMQEIPASSEEA